MKRFARLALLVMLLAMAWSVRAAAATTLPGPPQSLVASVSLSSFTLSWRPPTSGGAPTGYRIEVGARSGASDLGAFDIGLVTSVGPVGAPPFTLFVRVRARNAAGVGAPSNEVQVGAQCGRPDPPTNLTASVNAAAGQVTFHWKTPATSGPKTPTSFRLAVGVTEGRYTLGSIEVPGNVTSYGPVAWPSGL